MGEFNLAAFRRNSTGSIHVEARPERLSTEAGALLVRARMDDSASRLSLANHPLDTRDPDGVTHPFSEVLRTVPWVLTQGPRGP